MRLSDNADWMTEQPMAEEPPAIPDPGAEPAARDWLELTRRHRELETVLLGHQPGRARWTSSDRRAARGASSQAEELRGISRRTRGSSALLAALAAGSTREWNALSVIPRGSRWPELSLERTLSWHRRDLPSRWVDEALEAMPRIRTDAQLGIDTPALNDLHHGLLGQAVHGSPEIATVLLEHLPGAMRPIPSRVVELQRQTSHVTFHVSEARPDDWDIDVAPAITLGNIVVHGKGRGLGTALLIQLCRYADVTGSSIVGELAPGPWVPAARLPAIARWYARHGFTSGLRSPEEWLLGSRICRPPRS